MENRIVRFAAVAVFGMLAAGFAFASSTATATFSVSATIGNNCTISANALAFGSYDPVYTNTSGNPLDGSTTLSVTCTSGASTTVTLDQGLHPAGGSTNAIPLRQMKTGSSYLAYFLYQDGGYGTVWGNTVGSGQSYSGTGNTDTLTVYGQVTGGQNEPSGTYTDTVTATITF